MPAKFRRDFFFWLGVVILPPFWSWFTLGRGHSKLDRGLAFGWMAAFLAYVVVTWAHMASHYQFALANLQFISLIVGGALCVWLAARVLFRIGCPPVIDLVIGAWLAIVVTANPMFGKMFETICMLPLGQEHVLAILIPALLHLSLDPVQKGLDELG